MAGFRPTKTAVLSVKQQPVKEAKLVDRNILLNKIMDTPKTETNGIRGGRVSAVTKSSAKLGIVPSLSSVLGGHRSPQVPKSNALTIDLTKFASAK